MPIVGAAFLCAVSRAFARIHVENDDPWLTTLVHRVDPLARQIGKSGEVFRASHSVSKRPIWLAEAARSMGAFPPTTQRIAGSRHKPIGVVHILVTSQPAEYRLQVASVPAGTRL